MVAPFTTANELTRSLNCSLHTRIMHTFWYQLSLPSHTASLGLGDNEKKHGRLLSAELSQVSR